MFETSQKNNPMRTSVLAILAFLLFSTPSHATELGAYEGAGCTGVGKLSNFSDWLGRDVERGLDFVSYTSWDDFLHASRWSLQCWQKVKIPMTFSVPMLPKQPQTSLKDGANGLYDAHFYTLAEDLIKYAKKSLKNKKFIVAIQREPYVNIKTNDGIKLEKVAGGAHILLDGILRQIGGLMVAIGSGNADAETADAKGRIEVPPKEKSYTLKRVFLKKKDFFFGPG